MTPNYFLLRRLCIHKDSPAPLSDETAAGSRIPDAPVPRGKTVQQRREDAEADRYFGHRGEQRDGRDA